MENKVILALVDGMRPDGLMQCGNPFYEELRQNSTFCLNAQTVRRPITLPCHVSLFTGVEVDVHTVNDNIWHAYPQALPGIYENAHTNGKKTALLTTWGPLIHLGECECIDRLDFLRGDIGNRSLESWKQFEWNWTQHACEILRSNDYDFIFYYFEMADVVGHAYGWMSAEYLSAIDCAGTCLKMLYEALPDNYQMIVTADHGGHVTKHNDPNNPEDMTIPLYMTGTSFAKERVLTEAHILDIAPTVSDILKIEKSVQYRGRSLVMQEGRLA